MRQGNALSAEERPLKERLSQKELKVTLQPRAIELLSRRDMRLLLRETHPLHIQEEADTILEDARKVIYQTAFIAFLAGKHRAAQEARIQFWSVETNDMPTVEQLRQFYFSDFQKIFQGMLQELHAASFNPESYLQRCDLLLQMMTWTSYNQGKLALWDDEILKPQSLGAQRYKYEGAFMFKTAADDDVCDMCAPLSGQMSEDPHDLDIPPLHPWCLPGNSLVSPCGRITGVSKRVFNGDLIVIHTARGRNLSITPNHPIACEQGWIAAHLLNEGDNVICEGRRQIRFPNLGLDKHQNMPAPIEEIAKAFLLMPSTLRLEVPTAAEDFHGDGRNGEVAIIGTNRHLMPHDQAAFHQHRGELPFILGNSRSGNLMRSSGPSQFGESTPPSSTCSMSRPNLGLTLNGGHSGPLQQLSFMPSANMNACLEQPVVYGAPVNMQSGRKLFLGDPASVCLDEIVKIERQPFQGHIYNLETSAGYFNAEGIIVHNCRCEIVATPTVPTVEEQEDFLQQRHEEQTPSPSD